MIEGRTGRPPPAAGWRVGQFVCLLGLLAAPVGILVWPRVALPLFWKVLVPLLPICFLLNPALWRNVCPLATLGMGPEGAPTPPGFQPVHGFRPLTAPILGMVLLVLLVPLRGAGLEESALASAGLLAVAGGGALASRRRSRKAGFCNGWCPLLPVERLYGQAPLVQVRNARCPTCTTCTTAGCIDLSNRASHAQLLGPDRRGHGWLHTPWGAFAAGFPGFILAFFLAGPEPAGMAVVAGHYGILAGGAASSWIGVNVVVRAVRAGWRPTLLVLGCAAAGLYLWFALPVAWATLAGLLQTVPAPGTSPAAGMAGGADAAGPVIALLRTGVVLLCGACVWKGLAGPVRRPVRRSARRPSRPGA